MINENSTLEEVAQALSDKQNEKKATIINKGKIALELYRNTKERLELNEKKRLASETMELIRTDISLLTSMYFNKKEL